MHKVGVLLVGNFLSSITQTRGVCEDLADRLSLSGWAILTTSTKKSRIPRLFDMLSTVWRNRHHYSVAQVDVYSGFAFVWAEAVCYLLRRIKKPYILTLHGGNLPNFAKRWPGRMRRLLGSAAIVTAPSGYLVERMQPYQSRMCLLPNALVLDKYPFVLRSHTQPHLIWMRTFHSIYNPSLAIQALSLLRDTFPTIYLTMIGPDKGDGSFEHTRALTVAANLVHHVTFAGKITKAEVPARLNSGDIFINTTNIDNTPISVLEAMACGLCIISTNVDGIPYLLQNEYNALLVPPNDPVAMARAIYRVLTEQGLAARLSQNARNTAAQCDWSIVLPRWETLLMNTAQDCQ